jgi:gliding motility-associated transport system permease protein/gliding motility-associatede transport system auxiliary component
MKQVMSLVRKELNSYFGSPMALIFVGAFLAATLFTFFWADAFFSQGTADVRSLFRWMPILMIFLVAALTMRQWSEEQQSGTLEILLTLPARQVQLVLGKFLAAMILVAVALALTLFVPISISLLGNLDWGPVLGGYLAAILMAAAYVAIGLFISSRTNNQIVALILTVVVGGLFYLVGSSGITAFFGDRVAEILRAIGSGSRFESIQRGVIDLRDLVYYLSLTALFLTLNIVSLDSQRWSKGQQTLAYRRMLVLTVVLVGLNLAALNVWLYPVKGARLDLTAQQEYSLSAVTRDLLNNLQEPLLIRGYFSDRTHPLLAPLVPTIRDMLDEYRIASNGKVEVEIVDPLKDPEKEAEASQTYGIQPTPLQIADRYGASVVNAYFDILVRYGDQHEVLNFRDLIEILQSRTGQPEVRLRNLEYDLTRTVKRAIYGFQSIDAVLASLSQPAKLTLYVTPDTLPGTLKDAPATIQKVAEQIQNNSEGKFVFESVNVDAPGSTVTRQAMLDRFGLQPIAASLFSSESYYLHMVLQVGDKAGLVYPSGELTEASVRSSIESALKRSSTGFLKVVGLWTPPVVPQQDMFGQQLPSLNEYNSIGEQLGQDYQVRRIELGTGAVPSDIDALFVVAPQNLGDKERYAIDQYLMRGGSVIVAAGNYMLSTDPMGTGLAVKPIEGGVQEMLAGYGITVEKSMVMDSQNEPFPVQVNRDVGGMQVREIQAINYPFFVDVRPAGMDRQSPILANLPAVTMNWVSPVVVDEAKNASRQVTTLLKSSSGSWLRTATDIQPDLQRYPELGFPVEGEQASRPLAVAVQGVFESAFKGKPSPLEVTEAQTSTSQVEMQPQAQPKQQTSVGTIEKSPETARLIVVGSSEFLNDFVFRMSSTLSRDRYLNSLQFAQNCVDWSVEDLDLLGIRSRGTTSRLLMPLTEGQESFWEGLNYAVALLALIAVGLLWRMRRRNEKPMELLPRQSAQ